MINKKAENIDEELKEREIRRLTSPLKYPKDGGDLPTDIEENPVHATINFFSNNEYILEPKTGILTNDEILKYAEKSKTASKIRLKRGWGAFSDKTKIYGDNVLIIWMLIGSPLSLVVITCTILISNSAIIGLLFTLGIPISYTFYVYYLKDYTKPGFEKEISLKEEDNSESESTNGSFSDILTVFSNDNDNFSNNLSSLKTYEKQIHELENLYKIKEKIAIELIERRFTPPQITYDRFIEEIDNCNQVFYNQTKSALNIIKVATSHTPKVDKELEKRIDALKSLIEQIDELTNELAINLDHSGEKSADEVKELLVDMKKLVASVKEYE